MFKPFPRPAQPSRTGPHLGPGSLGGHGRPAPFPPPQTCHIPSGLRCRELLPPQHLAFPGLLYSSRTMAVLWFVSLSQSGSPTN